MQAKSEQKWIGTSIVLNTCFYFSIFSFVLCSLTSIVLSSSIVLIKVSTNFILLGVALLISIIISIVKSYLKKPHLTSKFKIPYFTSVSYVILYVTYYISAFFLPIKSSIFVVLAILGASIVFSVAEALVPIKNYLFKAFAYFIIYSVPYFILINISELGKGNKLFVAFAIYLVIYAVIFTTFYAVDALKRKYENETKDYKKMFK